MKFLLDQDVYSVTRRFLQDQKHDVVSVSEIGLARGEDLEVLIRAREEGRILVTRDRDFGGLVFAHDVGCGVVYLRVLPSTVESVHNQLQKVLTDHTESDLKKAFVVVEPGRYRFRKLPHGSNS